MDLLKHLNLKTVLECRNYFLSKLMFEAIHGLTPDYLTNLITMRVDIHRYETRSAKNDDVFIPQVKKDIYKNSLLVCGGKLWNELPGNIKESCSKNSFKTRYKKFFNPKPNDD